MFLTIFRRNFGPCNYIAQCNCGGDGYSLRSACILEERFVCPVIRDSRMQVNNGKSPIVLSIININK